MIACVHINTAATINVSLRRTTFCISLSNKSLFSTKVTQFYIRRWLQCICACVTIVSFDDTGIHFIYVTRYYRHGEAEVKIVEVTGKGDNYSISSMLSGAMTFFVSWCVKEQPAAVCLHTILGYHIATSSILTIVHKGYLCAYCIYYCVQYFNQ